MTWGEENAILLSVGCRHLQLGRGSFGGKCCVKNGEILVKYGVLQEEIEEIYVIIKRIRNHVGISWFCGFWDG